MDLYARINILGGVAVRLPHGGLDEAIPLDDDPIGRAHHWVQQGIDHLHVVDLDAAAYGDYRNRGLIDRLLEEIDVRVQVAGGIRSEVEAERLISSGAWRIVMGTAAIENQIMVWDLCREFPEKIAVSLDVRPDEEIATRGWTENSGRFLEEVLIEMSAAGVVAFLVAQAGRDVLTEPPNVDILAEALATVQEPVVASGGVRHLEDLRMLLQLEVAGRRLSGVIVGREVTAGRLNVEEAKEVLAGGGPATAPGGIAATRTAIGVQSLLRSLDFYTSVLGFHGVHTPTEGGLAVVDLGSGHLLELSEGSGARPDALVIEVEDLQRWKDHFSGVGADAETTGDGQLVIVDPDGLEIRIQQL